MRISFLKFTALFCLVLTSSTGFCQAPSKPDAAEILLQLNKLKVCGSALYIAAHPDDENTNLITVLSKEKLLNTAYLSLTRGDGGQNLIGTEQGDILGIIRTQELLEARKIDGGHQYFARARDFGFSKLPDETFNIWEKNKVLEDVVWAIRYLRPDIVITRFSLEPGRTHGHHTASAMLAVEAFDLAADSTAFPHQLKTLQTWQPKRVMWNSSKWFYNDDAKLMAQNPILMDCGNYNALLGKSYNEISAESRSMHKSQGFGSTGNRGKNIEYFEYLKGDKPKNELLENIDFSWNRVPQGSKINGLIESIISKYNAQMPSSSVTDLVKLYQAIAQLPNSYWKNKKLIETKVIIKNCMGLYLEAYTEDFSIIPASKVKINFEAINRSTAEARLEQISLASWKIDTTINQRLAFNIDTKFAMTATVSDTIASSQPYWLVNEGSVGMFDYAPELMQNPESAKPQVMFKIRIQDVIFDFWTPIIYKTNSPVKGEVYRPLEIVNPVSINLKNDLLLFPTVESKKIDVIVKAGKANCKGVVKISLPNFWKATPTQMSYAIAQKDEEQILTFTIYPAATTSEGVVKFEAIQENHSYNQGYLSIQHNHISPQVLLTNAELKVVRLNIKTKGTNIAYLMGAGDEVPSSLAQIGYKVTLLNDDNINKTNLAQFDAIVIGVRAFNTLDRIKINLFHLFEYTKAGGNLIVQYNTSRGLKADSISPFPLEISNDRVTVENAPVLFLQPQHPVLNTPNKITKEDFDDWKQERGLYFASKWSNDYTAILSCNDPNETPKDGGLLVAKYGKGNYIFTGYSFFRELPAGVPGAYRLFANLIGLGK